MQTEKMLGCSDMRKTWLSTHSSMLLLSCCLMLFLRPLGFCVIGMFTVEFREYFQWKTMEESTWFTACHMGPAVIISALIIGCMLERVGAPITLAISVLLGSGGLIIAAYIRALPALYIGYGFLAAWSFTAYNIIASAVLQHSFGEKRNLATGLGFTCMSVGSFVWPPLVRMAIDTYGWHGALLLLAAANLNTLPFAIILPKCSDPKSKKGVRSNSLLDPENKKQIALTEKVVCSENIIKSNYSEENDSNYHLREGYILKKQNSTIEDMAGKFIGSQDTKTENLEDHDIGNCCKLDSYSSLQRTQYTLFFIFSLSQLFNAFPNYALYLYIPIRCALQEFSKMEAVALISIMNICSASCRIVAGALGDLRCVNIFYIVTTATALCGLDLMFSPFCQGFLSLAIFAGVFGVGAAFFVTLVQGAIQKIGGPKELNIGLSMMFAAEGLCGFTFPISGWFMDYVGDINLVFVLLGVSGLIGSSLVLLTGLLHRKFIANAQYESTILTIT